jgi:hypothetical protein
MGISRHHFDDTWAVREKKEAGSTLALPAIRTLCLFNVIQNFCWYRGHLTVDAGNALEMLLQELVFFGHISEICTVKKTQHQY